MKVVIMPDRTHNPFDEIYRVSRLRENLTSGSEGEGLETGLRSTLNGHAGGNPGHSQGYSYGLPRQSFTRQRTFAWFGRCRRHSKDYERRTDSSESMLRVSAIHLMLKRLKPSNAYPPFRYRAAA